MAAGAKAKSTAAKRAAAERKRLHRLHRYERRAWENGVRLIGGVDEVGRGPLAGPVVAGCVVIGEPLLLEGLDDSKCVPRERREALAVVIKTRAIAWGIGEASVAEIDRLNIYWASVLAMERAIAACAVTPDYLLTDAVRIKSFDGEQEPVVKGDGRCASVAAASIIAKVHRDALLVALDALYPSYGFAEHKGYATERHITALAEHGPCREHRSGFVRVRAALELPGLVIPT